MLQCYTGLEVKAFHTWKTEQKLPTWANLD